MCVRGCRPGAALTYKQAKAFIARWRPVLCPEWSIDLEPGHNRSMAADHHLASIQPSADYLKATLHLGDVIGDELNERGCKRVLLHELLHLTLNDFERVAKEPANALGYEMNRLVKEQIDWQLERAVDRLSEVLVDLI